MENTHIRPTRKGLLAEIEAFLSASDMKKTVFGQAVANDPSLVDDIRNGRDPREDTAQKILGFISMHRPKP